MNALPDKKFGQWIRLACVVVSCIALWLVFRRVSIGALATPLLRLKFGWFLAAILLLVTALVLAAVRWHLMLRLTGLAVHAGATNRTVLIGHFFNTLLFGPTGGDLAKSALYSRWYRRPFADTLASSFLDRLLGLGGLVLFICVALGLVAAALTLLVGQKTFFPETAKCPSCGYGWELREGRYVPLAERMETWDKCPGCGFPMSDFLLERALQGES